jgi:hypothetical protein
MWRAVSTNFDFHTRLPGSHLMLRGSQILKSNVCETHGSNIGAVMGKGRKLALSQVLCLDWYDGPIQGVAINKSQGLTLEFHQIAVDKTLKQKVHAVSEISRATFDETWAACSVIEPPRRPFWAVLAQGRES